MSRLEELQAQQSKLSLEITKEKESVQNKIVSVLQHYSPKMRFECRGYGKTFNIEELLYYLEESDLPSHITFDYSQISTLIQNIIDDKFSFVLENKE